MRFYFVYLLIFFAQNVFAQEFKNSVIYFLDPECKLCLNKAKDINETIDKYNKYLNFVFIFPQNSNSKKVKPYLNMFKNNKKNIHAIFDDNNELSKKFNVNITPTVIFIDEENALIYFGALDDKDVSLTLSKSNKSISYIDFTILQFLNKEKPIYNFNKPIGCIFR